MDYQQEQKWFQKWRQSNPVKEFSRLRKQRWPISNGNLLSGQSKKKLFSASGEPYFDNELVISKANGIPARRERISANFGQLLRQLGMPHIRFHDLRHTAATNMHQLTGDFYTVGQILGHSLKGVGIQLGMGSNLESVTAQYVDVRLDRKRIVLEAYHDGVLKGK